MSADSGPPPDGHGPFFSRLHSILDGASRDGLVAAIVDYARRLDDAGRRELLGTLESDGEEAEGATGSDEERGDAAGRPPAGATSRSGVEADPDPPTEHPLLDEVDALVGRLEAGHYYQDWGWDPDIRGERAWGDESWADEMDVLFARTDEAFLADERALAREAYRGLLEAFLLEEGGNAFCGPVGPTEMVETDVAGAKARYFRCVYEAAPPERRAERLLSATRSLWWVGDGEVGLEAAADADADPLPGFADFLPAWIELLDRTVEPDGGPAAYGWPRTCRWLLREAVRVQKGEAGLGDLARRRGAEDPQAYHDWIAQLLEEDRLPDALDAAEAGMDGVTDPEERARLADVGGFLARRTGDRERAVRSLRLAWRSAPTAVRLLGLAAGPGPENAKPDGPEEALRDELVAMREGDIAAPGAVAALLEVLAGELGAAAERLREAPPLGWSRHPHPGPVVFPVLLRVGAGEPAPLKSVVADLLDDLERQIRWHRFSSIPLPVLPDPVEELREDPPPLGPLLEAALRRASPDTEARHRFLEAAERVARERTRAIVSNKHRGAYERAARVATAAAEAWHLAGDEERGTRILVELRSEFSRYYAFTGELRSVVDGSPVVRSVRPLLE